MITPTMKLDSDSFLQPLYRYLDESPKPKLPFTCVVTWTSLDGCEIVSKETVGTSSELLLSTSRLDRGVCRSQSMVLDGNMNLFCTLSVGEGRLIVYSPTFSTPSATNSSVMEH